jgi:hypothetical protein
MHVQQKKIDTAVAGTYRKIEISYRYSSCWLQNLVLRKVGTSEICSWHTLGTWQTLGTWDIGNWQTLGNQLTGYQLNDINSNAKS